MARGIYDIGLVGFVSVCKDRWVRRFVGFVGFVGLEDSFARRRY